MLISSFELSIASSLTVGAATINGILKILLGFWLVSTALACGTSCAEFSFTSGAGISSLTGVEFTIGWTANSFSASSNSSIVCLVISLLSVLVASLVTASVFSAVTLSSELTSSVGAWTSSWVVVTVFSSLVTASVLSAATLSVEVLPQ